MAELATRPKVGWRDMVRDPKLALMLGLGFSCGLPLLLVFGTLSAWLRTAGVSRTEIGLLSYVALAYTFKFAWAPFIDAYDVPVLSRLLGRRRAWMLVAQVTIAAGLIGLSFGDPATNLMYIVLCALLVAFASATQDVVVDGWRIDAAPTSRQGMMGAMYQLGYRLAMLCSGAGALYMADFFDWSSAYLAMAALTLIGISATFLTPGPEAAEQDGSPPVVTRPSFAKAVSEPLTEMIGRKGPIIFAILILIGLYRVPDFVAGIMANPLYIDVGFSLSEIASVSKIYGVWVGIAGAFAGGFAVTRLGLWWTVLIGAVVAAASNLMFSWLALSGKSLPLLTAAISVDNFAGGFAGTALIAYMSGLTSPLFAATQYALLSSLYALPGKFVGGLSGIMVDAFGYPTFFAITASIGIPIGILCLVIRRDTYASVEAARADEDAAAGINGNAIPKPA